MIDNLLGQKLFSSKRVKQLEHVQERRKKRFAYRISENVKCIIGKTHLTTTKKQSFTYCNVKPKQFP